MSDTYTDFKKLNTKLLNTLIDRPILTALKNLHTYLWVEAETKKSYYNELSNYLDASDELNRIRIEEARRDMEIAVIRATVPDKACNVIENMNREIIRLKNLATKMKASGYNDE